MHNFQKEFKDKKITVMGLGLLGRGVGDAVFLAECGAKLVITDLKTKEQLKASLDKLKKFKGIKYTLGEHKLEDFRNADFILKAAGVPLDSIYIKEAEKHGVPIEMSAALLVKLACLPVVGVTGTRGKSTVVYLINHILTSAHKKVILGGNVRGVSNLQLLKQVSKSDIIVLELDSWQLQGFGDSLVSPNIAVLTTFYDDHMGYYKGDIKNYFSDKAHVFKHQTEDDLLIIGEQALPSIKKFAGKIKNNIIIPKTTLPKGWKINLPGAHNEYNAMLAVEVARTLGISDLQIKKALKTFAPVSGRLEFLRSVKGIKIYNDNNSTTPEATIAALQAVGDTSRRKIVLILGGDNKFLDMSALIKEIPKFCSKVILFKEKGTDLIIDKIYALKKKGIEVYLEEGLKDTVHRAFSVAKKGETILYSPAFSSFGKYFKNEYDRGDQFIQIVKNLK
ncbi:MAG: UDP-N-acetylmuramoyl-L-alanine--D-glutamate ligase [Patescibacteria group bacterium]|nr:UDP-N-acetylmuramoyl-L-alanine--D-glutamate ligase [Patescibacteria group bacterium]